MSEAPPLFSSTRYFVAHQGQNRGPFDRQLIEAFLLSGYFPADIEVREEGSETWAKWTSVVTPPPIPDLDRTVTQPRRTALSKRNVVLLIAIVVAAGCLWLFSREQTTETVNPGSFTTLPEQNTPPDTSLSENTATPSFNSAASSSDEAPGGQRPSSSGYDVQNDADLSATPPTETYQDENGRTYILSEADYLRLSEQRKALVREQQSLKKGLDEVDIKRTELRRAQANLDRASQKAINAYNRKVDAYNALRARLIEQSEAFDRHKEAFNAELARVGRPQ